MTYNGGSVIDKVLNGDFKTDLRWGSIPRGVTWDNGTALFIHG